MEIAVRGLGRRGCDSLYRMLVVPDVFGLIAVEEQGR